MKFNDAYYRHYEGTVVGHTPILFDEKSDQYQAVFGFDVDDRGETVSVGFWIFEVESWDGTTGESHYLIRDSPGMEWTPYLDETDPIAERMARALS